MRKNPSLAVQLLQTLPAPLATRSLPALAACASTHHMMYQHGSRTALPSP